MALATGIVGATGCLRQTGMPAMASTPKLAERGPEKPEAPVETTDEPGAPFLLNGQPFCFAGTNNYYLTYKSHKMVDDVLETTKSMGLKVIRIWGYLDRGSLDGTVRNVDGEGHKNGVYFQYWDPEKNAPAYNDGATGLEHLDYVLAKAKTLDLKVMLVLTNNWKDFGGMDQYLVWFGKNQHHQFYTDPTVGKAYKDWIAHLVHRTNTVNGAVYRDDPTIFGWELGNEPRCTNSGSFDNRGGCTSDMLVHWADEMSNYIKTIDPNHMVSVGDEGFFDHGSGPSYDGSEGVDHVALLGVRHIDFGTYHLYPESWGHRVSWGSKWIQDHIDAARAAGKPTLLEEYGLIARRNASGAITDDERRRKGYLRWDDMVEKRGGAGALFWMLAGIDDEPDAQNGMYPDYDHFELYATDAVGTLLKGFAGSMATDAQVCKYYSQFGPSGVPPAVPFVRAAPAPNRPQALGDRANQPPT
ncbi:MAG TPA: cellulase family glycosylhydrolase [Polyangiaceae bacterium]